MPALSIEFTKHPPLVFGRRRGIFLWLFFERNCTNTYIRHIFQRVLSLLYAKTTLPSAFHGGGFTVLCPVSRAFCGHKRLHFTQVVHYRIVSRGCDRRGDHLQYAPRGGTLQNDSPRAIKFPVTFSTPPATYIQQEVHDHDHDNSSTQPACR